MLVRIEWAGLTSKAQILRKTKSAAALSVAAFALKIGILGSGFCTQSYCLSS